MSKLILMQGLPASGKSTKAKEIVESSGNTVRLSRDFFREMLHFGKWTGRNEGKTLQASRILAEHFLAQGTNVIIDDTNLNPEIAASWKHLALSNAADFKVVKMDTTWQECVRRDEGREKEVGKHVIKQMALRYGRVAVPEKGWVLCDIDGTIADVAHRLHFVKPKENSVETESGMNLACLCGKHQEDSSCEVYLKNKSFKKNWKAFFEGIPLDPVRDFTRKLLVDLYNKGHNIIFVSARPEDYREATLKWLEENGVGFCFEVLMRKKGDSRPDTMVKQEILNTYFPNKSDIFMVIDDRPSVIRMWRENGLNVVDVGPGIEF